MDFSIHNHAPDCDLVQIVVGDNVDSQVSVSVGRNEDGSVEIIFRDNLDNSLRKLILGKPGFSEHSDFGE